MAKQAPDNPLSQLAEATVRAEDLETLTRPMLVLLESITGLESTYLTTVDEARGVQKILYSRNVSESFRVPQDLSVAWGDTLCKRALEEGRPYTNDVSSCWGDSDAARALGINTYMSQPVRTMDGQLYGTLCAASPRKAEVPEEILNVFTLMAKMIAQQVDRERMLENMRNANAELSRNALSDPLTGVANRRGMEQELKRMLARAAREGAHVQVAFIDLDGFKAINDTWGHDVGDRFLLHIAGKLGATTRPGDLVARTGGDEFVVLAPGDGPALRERLEKATIGPFSHGACAIDYGGASVGVALSDPKETGIEGVLKRADAAMYEVKKKRKGPGASPR